MGSETLLEHLVDQIGQRHNPKLNVAALELGDDQARPMHALTCNDSCKVGVHAKL